MPARPMQCFRITKYDPRHRDASGHYLRDEWTSYSDIGESRAGTVLTFETYLQGEDAYLDAIAAMMRCAAIESVTVAALELRRKQREELGEFRELGDGSVLDVVATRAVATFVLREVLWCKLLGPAGFYIHFGWDYYMYIGGTFRSRLPALRGLYIEPFASPYHGATDKRPR